VVAESRSCILAAKRHIHFDPLPLLLTRLFDSFGLGVFHDRMLAEVNAGEGILN